MKIEEFRKELPTETTCDVCGTQITDLNWAYSRFGSSDWMAVCLVKCSPCSRVKVAAAGTSHEAHHRAQMIRLELVLKLEGRDWRPHHA